LNLHLLSFVFFFTFTHGMGGPCEPFFSGLFGFCPSGNRYEIPFLGADKDFFSGVDKGGQFFLDVLLTPRFFCPSDQLLSPLGLLRRANHWHELDRRWGSFPCGFFLNFRVFYSPGSAVLGVPLGARIILPLPLFCHIFLFLAPRN